MAEALAEIIDEIIKDNNNVNILDSEKSNEIQKVEMGGQELDFNNLKSSDHHSPLMDTLTEKLVDKSSSKLKTNKKKCSHKKSCNKSYEPRPS